MTDLSEIISIVDFEKAVLFGSYAGGIPREESDIDIGIFVKSIDGDYLDTLKKLYRARRTIDVRIEPHFFITCNDLSGFSEEVENTVLPL